MATQATPPMIKISRLALFDTCETPQSVTADSPQCQRGGPRDPGTAPLAECR
ncbi:hypothetical protein GCM10023148_46410 [Actinokineospora soli]